MKTICTLIFCLSITAVYSQSPGLIVRPIGGNGITPLNPNGNGYTSATTAGFTTSDITQSEILYKVVPPAISEPVADLLRGPATMFSDLVKQVDGSGFYIFNDGTNLLVRLRLGGIVSGSKGYSVLIDTDQKFGATGANADPNFVAATTGINGNPGFELELVLETNFRIAVYNVDGSSNPVLLNSYSINTNSQISVALSVVSGNPDYFYDFYVPLSALGITATTPIRLVATTVMDPGPAIGGPKSDIYGVDDGTYNDPTKSWETVITNQPPFTADDIKSGGGGVSATCTAAPQLTSPIGAGSNVSVGGTWTRLDATKPSTATITLYKNGISTATTTATSGVAWSITGLNLAASDVLYAKAQSAGESMCLQSNSVTAVTCANPTTTTGLTIACITRKGIRGTRPSNAVVKLYVQTAAGITLLADDNSTTYLITYPDATTWWYDGSSGGGSDPCTSSANDISDGSYAVTATSTGFCESGFVRGCLNLTATATPVITQTTLYTSNTTVSGTAAANSTVRLFLNSKLFTTATADGSGNYSFTNLNLSVNDLVEITAQSTGLCVSAVVSRTVSCYTIPPVINTTISGGLAAGSTTITGKSGEPVGSVVRVYENSVLLGSTTVQSGGTWSYTYTVVATRSYYATQQNGSCAVSAASATAAALAATTVCPTITGTYNQLSASVSGTMPSSFSGTVRLYLDGSLIGSAILSSATAWNISVNTSYTNTLYPGGVLTVTAEATGNAENTTCNSSAAINCTAPATPSYTASATTITVGQTVTYTIDNAVSNALYSVIDASAANYAGSVFAVGSNLSLTTNPFNSAGTYNLYLSANTLEGPSCISNASFAVTVNAAMPVKLISFKGKLENKAAKLSWVTSGEINFSHFELERSRDGSYFQKIAAISSKNNGNAQQNYEEVDTGYLGEKVFYRLKMVDIDASFAYSNVVVIKNSTPANILYKIMPNPFREKIIISAAFATSKIVTVKLLDNNGKVMHQQNYKTTIGNNQFEVHTKNRYFPGLYLLCIISDNKILYQQKILHISNE